MAPLDVKLLRDLRRLWTQSLAIALVLAAGVAILVLAFGAQVSLVETRAAYYERNRFADVFAAATRAPLLLTAELSHIPGVQAVEARVAGYAVLDLPGVSEPATARILSLPPDGEPALNLPILRAGRMPDPARPEEVVVNAPFAEANRFRPGDRFAAVLKGRLQQLTIAGTVLSPEFIYTIGPGGLMPDDRRFGIVWMTEEAAAAAFGLQGGRDQRRGRRDRPWPPNRRDRRDPDHASPPLHEARRTEARRRHPVHRRRTGHRAGARELGVSSIADDHPAPR